jgi:pyruvate formate lyase activating enzyme
MEPTMIEEEFLELLDWYVRKLGKEVPLHISRYFPRYKFNNPPTDEEYAERVGRP